jgi:hypothetical protein
MRVPRARSDADWERQISIEPHGRARERSRSAPAGKQASIADYYRAVRFAHEADASPDGHDE